MFTMTKLVTLFAAAVFVKAMPTVQPQAGAVPVTYTGEGTFDDTGLGACGVTNYDDQDIAAVSPLLFDTYPGYTSGNPNENPLCGKTANVTYQGKTISVLLMDRCDDCAIGDLNFSPHAFSQFAEFDVGRISNISWAIVD